jgi:hypothetical protein
VRGELLLGAGRRFSRGHQLSFYASFASHPANDVHGAFRPKSEAVLQRTGVQAFCFEIRVRHLYPEPTLELSLSPGFGTPMIEAVTGDAKINGIRRIGSQPIALAAAALVIIVIGAGSIAMWRAYSGTSPELDRIAAVRQVQAKAALASEQLTEKTNALDTSQQETIDQLQVVQDQLQAAKRQLAAQQADAKRLSEQVGELSGAIDSLRQSFANAQAPEAPSPRATRSYHHFRHHRHGKSRH